MYIQFLKGLHMWQHFSYHFPAIPPHDSIWRRVRHGRAGQSVTFQSSETTLRITHDETKLPHLTIFNSLKLRSFLKPSDERETRFGLSSMCSDVISVRFWKAKILSSSFVNSSEDVINKLQLYVLFIFGCVELSAVRRTW